MVVVSARQPMWLGYSIPDSVPGIDSSPHSRTYVFDSAQSQAYPTWNILTAPQTRGLQRRAACSISAWPTLRDGVLPPSQLRECVRRGPPGGSLRSHPATSEFCQVYGQWAEGGRKSFGYTRCKWLHDKKTREWSDKLVLVQANHRAREYIYIVQFLLVQGFVHTVSQLLHLYAVYTRVRRASISGRELGCTGLLCHHAMKKGYSKKSTLPQANWLDCLLSPLPRSHRGA